jgi:hypothetical protein
VVRTFGARFDAPIGGSSAPSDPHADGLCFAWAGAAQAEFAFEHPPITNRRYGRLPVGATGFRKCNLQHGYRVNTNFDDVMN